MSASPACSLLEPIPDRRALVYEEYRDRVGRPVVLVVDDEPGIREILAVGLTAHGYDVVAAADGARALALCREHDDAIVAALIDKRMPGLPGLQTLAAVRQLAPHVRCWLMTGDGDTYTAEELRALGAAGFLRKPFYVSDVAGVLGA